MFEIPQMYYAADGKVNGYGSERKRETASDVLTFFDKQENGGKPIPGRESLRERLQMLEAGETVDVLCFNCIDFTFLPKKGEYPRAKPSVSTETALVSCFKNELEETVAQLQRLGDPAVTIIIPDSELRDSNVFNFADSEKDRLAIGKKLEETLAEQFPEVSVKLWSRFLSERGLPSPETYTEQALPRVMGQYKSSLRRMVKESQAYLTGKGLTYEQITQIDAVELMVRSAWYLAMYAGEGMAMSDIKNENGNPNALVLNFENDGKVTTWYQRGASPCMLPVLTPADTTKYKSWKEEKRKQKKGNVIFGKDGV